MWTTAARRIQSWISIIRIIALAPSGLLVLYPLSYIFEREDCRMEVRILKHPTDEDWLLCKKMAYETINKETDIPPTYEWKVRMLKAGHSPIRLLNFLFELKDIPYWVSVHLVRHVHAVPFVSSQRNDRQDKYDRTKAPQDAPVTMGWYVNAEELITIAHKRLCMLAAPETRAVVQEICRQVNQICPEFSGLLVPNCVYRNGKCEEFKPCGREERPFIVTHNGGIVE